MNKAKIAAVFLIFTIFTGAYAQALDGRAAVAANGVFPVGDYGKATGFLPGDTVVVTNHATGNSLEIMILEAGDPSDGLAVILSPEAAAKLKITKNKEAYIKIQKKQILPYEKAVGTAEFENVKNTIESDPDKNPVTSLEQTPELLAALSEYSKEEDIADFSDTELEQTNNEPEINIDDYILSEKESESEEILDIPEEMVEVKPLDSISEIAKEEIPEEKEDKIISYESTEDEYEVYKKLIDDLSQPQEEPAVEEVAEAEETAVEEIAEIEDPVVEEIAEIEEPAVEEIAEIEEPAVEEIAKIEEPVVEEIAEIEEPVVEEIAETEEPAVEEIAEIEEPAVEEIAEIEEPTVEEVAETEEPVVEEVAEIEEPGSDKIEEVAQIDEPELEEPVFEVVIETEEPALEETSEVEEPDSDKIEEVAQIDEPELEEEPVEELEEPVFEVVIETEEPALEETSEVEEPGSDKIEEVAQIDEPELEEEPALELEEPVFEVVIETEEPALEETSELETETEPMFMTEEEPVLVLNDSEQEINEDKPQVVFIEPEPVTDIEEEIPLGIEFEDSSEIGMLEDMFYDVRKPEETSEITEVTDELNVTDAEPVEEVASIPSYDTTPVLNVAEPVVPEFSEETAVTIAEPEYYVESEPESVLEVSEPVKSVAVTSETKTENVKESSEYKDILITKEDFEKDKYYIQIATLSKQLNVDNIISEYGAKYPVKLIQLNNNRGYQVLVGPFTEAQYSTVLMRFKAKGYKDAFVRK